MGRRAVGEVNQGQIIHQWREKGARGGRGGMRGKGGSETGIRGNKHKRKRGKIESDRKEKPAH